VHPPYHNGVFELPPVGLSYGFVSGFAVGNHLVNKFVASSTEDYEVLFRCLIDGLWIPNVMSVVVDRLCSANLALPLFPYQGLQSNGLPLVGFQKLETVGVLGFDAHFVLAIYSGNEYVASVYGKIVQKRIAGVEKIERLCPKRGIGFSSSQQTYL
jgi:hypothetical protein